MLDQGSFVSAAFHWCEAMQPKAQPTFQLRGMDSTPVGVRGHNRFILTFFPPTLA